MADWVTDGQIANAYGRMDSAFNAMEDPNIAPAVMAAKHAARHHLHCVLALDPAKIRDEYERLFGVAMAVGDNEYAVAKLRLTGAHLASWNGEAADRFKEQITMMEKFCDNQKTRILQALQGVAAVYSIAVEGRASYLSLVEAATNAADNVYENRKTKETGAAITVLGDLVGGIITRDPNSMLRSISGTLVGIAKDILPIAIDDSGSERVADGYRQQADRLCQSMGHALDSVRHFFAAHRDSALTPPRLFTPLPAYCDIRSPDFSYEHFGNSIHNPGPIGPVVEAERRRYIEERASHDSEIERRLNQHSDKGAV